jgi:hypothetical protein
VEDDEHQLLDSISSIFIKMDASNTTNAAHGQQAQQQQQRQPPVYDPNVGGHYGASQQVSKQHSYI